MPLKIVVTALFALILVACDGQGEDNLAQPGADASEREKPALTVYKSPSCGCCEEWIAHLEGNDFQTTAEHPEDMQAIKTSLNIAPEYGSCHTGVSESGYVFEGHVPARLVRQFLNDPPDDALGLAVPRMPIGSPGMEVGDHFQPYEVLLLKTDGSSEVYAHIETAEAQY